MDPHKEQIVLVDKDGNEIGTALKLASHHADTPLHRAFSCYIFNEQGKFLVTQRALVKKVWPGVWSNSVCGHPAPNETYEDAIRRRVSEELGMKVKDIRIILDAYTYKTPPYNGVVENEFCPIYIARAATNPDPNPEEVEAFSWHAWDDYVQDIKTKPEIYSYWAKDQLTHLQNSTVLKEYWSG